MKKRYLSAVLLLTATIVHAATAWYVPARGTPERKQALDALRSHMRQFDAQPQLFMVREVCLGKTFGWLSVEPQSPDGLSHYEPLNATLRREGRGWKVEVLACGEQDCPAGTEAAALRARVAPRCR
ncbi:MAG: hypothetical protein LH470_12275 [Lysobacter sp.]|nr:hypothetical protein [Lysobacter sp.]